MSTCANDRDHQVLHAGAGPGRTPGCLRSECRLTAIACRGLPGRGDGVQPTAGPVFSSGDLRILPPAPQQSHFFEPPQRAVQRPVSGQQPRVGLVAEPLGDLVAMKLPDALPHEIRGAGANGKFERDEAARLSTHGAL